MPKFISPKHNKEVLFVHIPRTGGRFVTNTLLQNGYLFSHEFEGEHCFLDVDVVDRVQSMHFHYPLLAKYYAADTNPLQFTIVRDPLQRFISSFWGLNECMKRWGVFHEDLENYSYFKLCIEFYLYSGISNWFRPQVEFVGPLTKIWKYENGFNSDWKNWMEENNIPVPLPNDMSYRKYEYDLFKASGLSSPIVDNIKKFYKEDYEFFDYPVLPA